MNFRFATKTLAVLCLAELVVIVGLVLQSNDRPFVAVQPNSAPVGSQQNGSEATHATVTSAERNPAPPDLVQQNKALETELTVVKQELEQRKSEISFSYGSVRDSGRFVGMTFRKMFEAAAARESTEAKARIADNQINVLSLGPFIQDAEVIESDPVAFAQFQAPLISEVLGLPPEKSAEVEALLAELKTKSLKLEEGSAEWIQLNDTALQKITAYVPESQRPAMKGQLNFFQQYGVLVIPAYSILRAPTPTIASP
jgi:hypothetical protein